MSQSYAQLEELCAKTTTVIPGLHVQIQDLWPHANSTELHFDGAAKLVATIFSTMGIATLTTTLRERSVEIAEERIMGLTYADKNARQAGFRQLFSRLTLRLATVLNSGRPTPSMFSV